MADPADPADPVALAVPVAMMAVVAAVMMMTAVVVAIVRRPFLDMQVALYPPSAYLTLLENKHVESACAQKQYF
jgi:hypothetical protein